MTDISRPNWFEADFRFRAGEAEDFLNEFQDGNRFAVASVEDACCVWGFSRKGECSHDVLHKNEIPRLATVTIDGDGLSAEGAVEEDWHGGGIGAAWILSRPKDIEKTDACRLQPALAGIEAAVVFAVELGDGIGTLGIRRHAFHLGLDGIFAIHGCRAGEAEFLHAVLAARLEHIEKPTHIELHGFIRALHGFRHTNQCCQMEDVLYPLHDFVEELFVHDGSLHEPALEAVEVLAVSAAQVVQNDHLCDVLIILHHMTADEAASACDENFHFVTFLTKLFMASS